MLPSGDVHILAQSGMGDGLEDLEASQDLDGVWGERKSIAATHIMRKRRSEEGGGPQFSISEGLHDHLMLNKHTDTAHTIQLHIAECF